MTEMKVYVNKIYLRYSFEFFEHSWDVLTILWAKMGRKHRNGDGK